MEDIANDVANCQASKLSDHSVLTVLKQDEPWHLIHRAVVKSNQKSFVITALGQTLENAADEFDIRKTQKRVASPFDQIKLNLYETSSGAAETFMF
jgi:hypothetical protein